MWYILILSVWSNIAIISLQCAECQIAFLIINGTIPVRLLQECKMQIKHYSATTLKRIARKNFQKFLTRPLLDERFRIVVVYMLPISATVLHLH